MTRASILNSIENERSRHFELPGSEMDVKNTPNEWAAIAAHYLTDEVRRGGHKPSRAAFEQSFIKAAAVILAALECSDSMSSMGYFSDESADSLGDVISKIESMIGPE